MFNSRTKLVHQCSSFLFIGRLLQHILGGNCSLRQLNVVCPRLDPADFVGPLDQNGIFTEHSEFIRRLFGIHKTQWVFIDLMVTRVLRDEVHTFFWCCIQSYECLGSSMMSRNSSSTPLLFHMKLTTPLDCTWTLCRLLSLSPRCKMWHKWSA